MTTFWFALARAVHLTSCLLLMAFGTFDQFVLPRTANSTRVGTRHNSVACRLVLLCLALASGALWLGFVASQMSGLPLEAAIRCGALQLVWGQTKFGALWRLRTAVAVAATVVVIAIAWRNCIDGNIASEARRSQSSGISRLLDWLGLLLFAGMTATLAWAGHGRTGGGGPHLAADAVHLLTCGFWPGGLLPLAIHLRRLRSLSPVERSAQAIVVIRRFSVCSLAAVLVLAGTGTVNAYFLVGSLHGLLTTDYGRLLVLKLAAFGLIIAIAAVNLRVLSPRIRYDGSSAPRSSTGHALSLLGGNVTAELCLVIAVQLIVGFLGLLPPAAEHWMHHHP